MGTEIGDLSLSTRGNLARGAAEVDLGEGLRIAVCSLDDLMRMKRAADRPKDRIELEILAAVKEERQKQNGNQN